MFGLSETAVIVVLIIALLIIPKQLPKLFKSLSESVKELRKINIETKETVREITNE